MANMLLSSGLEAAQMAYQHKCREEDMIHRKIENQRRLIDNARRKVRPSALERRIDTALTLTRGAVPSPKWRCTAVTTYMCASVTAVFDRLRA